MTVHFAAARCSASSPVARALSRRAVGRVANDNCEGITDDKLLHAALRHFAQHGLGAAREAHERAQEAFFVGDRRSYDWWLGVCQALDRRLAESLPHSKPTRPDLIG